MQPLLTRIDCAKHKRCRHVKQRLSSTTSPQSHAWKMCAD